MNEAGNILVIPRHLVFVRFLEVPSMDDSEIKNIVELQAIKEIPYSKEEMIVRYKKFEPFKQGFTYLMMVVARKKAIEDMIEARNKEDTVVQDVKLYTELLYESLFKENYLNNSKAVLVLEIGRASVEIMALDGARIVFSRGFKNSSLFFEEVTKSILSYEKAKDSKNISDIIVRFEIGVDINQVKTFLSEHFNVPIRFYEYKKDPIDITLKTSVNLIPKEVTDRRASSQKKQELIIIYALLSIFIVLFFGFFSFKLYEKQKIINVLSMKIDKLQLKSRNLAKLSKRVEFFKKRQKKGKYVIGTLKDAFKLIPGDVTITGLEYKGGGAMSFLGMSQDVNSVFGFVKSLEASKIFIKVDIKYATKKQFRGQEITDFNIECSMRQE